MKFGIFQMKIQTKSYAGLDAITDDVKRPAGHGTPGSEEAGRQTGGFFYEIENVVTASSRITETVDALDGMGRAVDIAVERQIAATNKFSRNAHKAVNDAQAVTGAIQAISGKTAVIAEQSNSVRALADKVAGKISDMQSELIRNFS